MLRSITLIFESYQEARECFRKLKSRKMSELNLLQIDLRRTDTQKRSEMINVWLTTLYL